MKTAKVVQQISAAVALHSTSGAEIPRAKQTQSTETVSHVTPAGIADHTSDLIPAASRVTTYGVGSIITISIAPRAQWSKKERARFEVLVTKEALEEITSEEAAELEQLQQLKTKFTNPPTGEEILRRYQRERLDEGMIHLVEKYVRFEQ